MSASALWIEITAINEVAVDAGGALLISWKTHRQMIPPHPRQLLLDGPPAYSSFCITD
jgi:hypothetical protein